MINTCMYCQQYRLSFSCTTDESDYTPLNPESLDVFLTFDETNRRHCFSVSITNDTLVEGSEQFSLELLPDSFQIGPPPIPVMFNASLATVTILDQDGKI